MVVFGRLFIPRLLPGVSSYFCSVVVCSVALKGLVCRAADDTMSLPCLNTSHRMTQGLLGGKRAAAQVGRVYPLPPVPLQDLPPSSIPCCRCELEPGLALKVSAAFQAYDTSKLPAGTLEGFITPCCGQRFHKNGLFCRLFYQRDTDSSEAEERRDEIHLTIRLIISSWSVSSRSDMTSNGSEPERRENCCLF